MSKNLNNSDLEISEILENLKNDISIYKNKLSSKNEALIIMRRELDNCQMERDQFKLMAEQVQQRYQDLRKSLENGAKTIGKIDEKHAKLTTQQLISLLHESREANKVLQFELDEKQRKLNECHGDIKLLRGQLTRQKFGMADDVGIALRNFPQHEREALITRVEQITDKYNQLSRDLEQCLDEKQELVTERDVYKTKYDKLNAEINYILRGEDSLQLHDKESLLLENKLLKEQLESMENERSEALATVSKYNKNQSDKRRGRASVPNMETSPLTLSPVHASQSSKMTSKTGSTLHLLIRGLIETINDKNLALSHQRKANNLLADKMKDLESKLKALEMSGLWNTDSNNCILQLKNDYDNVKKLTSSLDKYELLDKQSSSFIFEEEIPENSENLTKSNVQEDPISNNVFEE